MDVAARGRRPVRRIKVRGRILLSGGAAGIAIAVAALVILGPMSGARSDLRQIRENGLPVQAQLVELRTTLTQWQAFLEPHFDALAPGSTPAPAQLAEGAQIATGQTAQAKVLARSLRRIGFQSDATDLESSMRALDASIAKLTPIAAGATVAAKQLRSVIAAERAAIGNAWTTTSRISSHLSTAITTAEVNRAADHLAVLRRLFLIAASLAVLLVLGASIVLGLRAGRQERDRQRSALRREYESRLQKALEMTKTEADVYGIVGTALEQSLPKLKVEMLIADSSQAHFRRALTNDPDFDGCNVISPLDCPAARGGQALVFPSSRALDACPRLKGRASGECSAVCLPLSVAGTTIGVTHAVGADGSPAADGDIETMNFTSARGSERIARIRTLETSESQAHTDPLTGLLNRRSLELQVRDLYNERTPYALAYGDLDQFKVLNDTFGHDAGDQALRAFSGVLRDSVRPNDIVARYGGEEFVIVFPDCGAEAAARVLERVREHLALTLSAGRVPAFTVTFGVASTEHAADFDEIVTIADHALLDAKAAGRNRVRIADLSAPIST